LAIWFCFGFWFGSYCASLGERAKMRHERPKRSAINLQIPDATATQPVAAVDIGDMAALANLEKARNKQFQARISSCR